LDAGQPCGPFLAKRPQPLTVGEGDGNMSIKDRWKSLTPEQKEKAKSAKTPEDILALAKEDGYELSDDELESIAGGDNWTEQWD